MEQTVKNPAMGLFPRHLAVETIAFPYPVTGLQVVQTHISIVLLAGDFAYKIKKPVKFPFVDYSTLEKRRAFCQKEVELNRRLAPDVYLEVVPVSTKGGSLCLEGAGAPVEYAVKMRRLPEEHRLNRLLGSGRLPPHFWTNLVDRLARFYEGASQGPDVSRWAKPGAVEEDWNQILSQVRVFPARILTPELWGKLESGFRDGWNRHRPRIESRSGRAREGHGDLRMEHVYGFPEKAPPGDILIIDCVEFDPRYRCGDPLLDIAFLAADLEAQGFNREARLFTQAWLHLNRDEEDLLSFYIAYRHLVRGLVRGLQAQEADLPLEERQEAERKTRVHFLMALGKLPTPRQRPCLVLLSGLPATGKSSLGRALEKEDGFQVLSSDLVRKELAGLSPASHSAAGWNQGLYTPEWTDKTYSTLLERAGENLLKGRRVLVDAGFWEQARREPFHRLAKKLRVPFLLFTCRAGVETVRQRLRTTERHGSDADFQVYRQMSGRWQEPPAGWKAVGLDTEKPFSESLREIRRVLAGLQLSV